MLDANTNMRELSGDELDLVAGGQSLVGGAGSLVDITATGTAVVGILGGVGSLLNGLITTTSSTGKGLLGGLLG
jgi:hypothetical protein